MEEKEAPRQLMSVVIMIDMRSSNLKTVKTYLPTQKVNLFMNYS